MLFLKSQATLTLRLLHAVTTKELPFFATFHDVPAETFDFKTGTSTGTDPIAIIDASFGQYREVKFISIFNQDSAAADLVLEVTIDDDATTATQILSVTLAVADTLTYTAADGFKVIDTSGKIKVTSDMAV